MKNIFFFIIKKFINSIIFLLVCTKINLKETCLFEEGRGGGGL